MRFRAKTINLLLLTSLAPSITAGAELRPLRTDRPDTTESPYTLDAGHFQFEMEIANWTRDRHERGYSLGELNSKVGLDPVNDLQLVLPFYTHSHNGGEDHVDFLTSATSSHPISENAGFFLELVSILGTNSSKDWEAYFNTGLTWAFAPMWQLDGGIRTGLTPASADCTPFVGASTKF